MATRVTLADVARAAGVSTSTASRALAGRVDMGAATRARVTAAARELGYERGAERRGRPRAATARLVDLVLGHFHSPWSDEVTAGARTAAARAGYDLVLTVERDDAADDWPARVRARGSAGVVLGIIRPTVAQIELLREASVPLVLLDPRADLGVPVAAIGTTDARGGADAAGHLLERGAEHVIVLSGEPRYRYGRARVEAFVATVRDAGADVTVEVVGAGWTSARAHAAILSPLRRAMSLGRRVAVFATADELAMGAYAAASDLGLSIPRDLMVVGFDDVPVARWLSPPLTTVRQPIREMASRAVDLMLSGERVVGRHELPSRLIVRSST